jgi:hypothetical protein
MLPLNTLLSEPVSAASVRICIFICIHRIQGALEKEQTAVADVQRQLASMRAELASPMSSSLSKAEQQQLGELGPGIQQLTSQLAAARAAKRKVRRVDGRC